MVTESLSLQMHSRVCFLNAFNTLGETTKVVQFVAWFFKKGWSHMITEILTFQIIGKKCRNNARTHMQYSAEWYIMLDDKNSRIMNTDVYYGQRNPFFLQNLSLQIYGWWKVSRGLKYLQKQFAPVAHRNIRIPQSNRRWQAGLVEGPPFCVVLMLLSTNYYHYTAGDQHVYYFLH